MLTIRQEQVSVFDQAATAAFEREMVLHLQQFAPRHSQVIGESGVEQVVRRGVARAQQCGFTNRGPIRLYLELMSMFGSDFATDPLLTWAIRPLADESGLNQMLRADQLHSAALAYLETIAGPANEHSLAALRRMAQAKPDGFSGDSDAVEPALMAAFRNMYPEKAAYAGSTALAKLVSESRDVAQRLQITGGHGLSVIAGLMFAVGHGACDDPLFPWISRTLRDRSLDGADTRATKLHERAMTYLNHALAYLEQQGLDVSRRIQ